MKTSSFFNVSVKLFGIYFYVQALLDVPIWIASFTVPFSFLFLVILAKPFLYVLFGWILTTYSQRITDRLIGQEEDCTIDMPALSVISIALIFLGGWLAVNAVTGLFTSDVLSSGFKLVVGCILVYAHRQIAGLIDRVSR